MISNDGSRILYDDPNDTYDDGEPKKESRRSLVKEIQKKIKSAKDHHNKAFKRMRRDQELVHKGTSKTAYMDGKKYVANIVQRHVQQRVSSLYAKNPKASFKRRKRMDFAVWDETVETLQEAVQSYVTSITSGIQPDMSAVQIIQDYENGMERRRLLDRLGKTIVALFEYYTDEQEPSFKMQMKQMVRRAIVTGVGYIKIDFQRSMKRNPSVQMHIENLQTKLGKIKQITDDLSKEDMDPDDPEAHQLELMLQELEQAPMDLDQEGVVFAFPYSTDLIIDPECSQLQGFIGANWIAEEHFFEPSEVEQIWDLDLKDKKFMGYSKNKASAVRNGGPAYSVTDKMNTKARCCVWEYYDKTTGLRYFVMDGYPNFLEEPGSPNVVIERFFPYYSLVFNAIEDEKELYPPSDVHLIKPMQDDHNFAREGLREHRRAARPKYVTPAGVFDQSDIDKLSTHQPHHVATIKGMQKGQKAADFISLVPSANIDTNLYITNHLMDDIQIVVGAQEANFGAVSNATATETSIAEGSRVSSLQSNIDDLDDLLSAVARDSGQVMMKELSSETVLEIVGPGAEWPEFTNDQIEKEITLKIEAGSSGRPNKAAELANIERVLPYLIQIPGIKPVWLAKEILRRMDDRLDMVDAIEAGVPSIQALNSIATDQQSQALGSNSGTGGAQVASGSSPASQGQNGGNNQSNPRETQPGPQAGFPSPSEQV